MIGKLMMWYCILGAITYAIGSYRALTDKTSTPPDWLSSLSWFIVWWMYLPTFIIRYIKYKIKGKNL